MTTSRAKSRAGLLITCIAMAATVAAKPVPRKRSVEMEITLPNGAVTRVVVPNGEGAIVSLPNQTHYGFVPMVRDEDDAKRVEVTIWDVDSDPSRQLGNVELEVGGSAVHSGTMPPFTIRVSRITKPK